MASGTRSSCRKVNDGENNDLKGSQNNGKKSENLGTATVAASGVRRSPRETLSKKNATPQSSSGTRKSERLEKLASNLNSMTPATRKTERVEKKKTKKNAGPLRRSERGKMPSSSASSGSKRSDKSLDVLNMKRKKDKKDKCVNPLTMQTVEINKIEQENVQAKKTQKKRLDARSNKALFTKQPRKADGTDHCDDLNGTDTGRKDDILEEFPKITHEKTMVTSTIQFADEELKRNNEHKLFPTSQKNSCKDMSSNGDDLQISQNGLVAEETNDAAKTATLRNLQSPQLVPGGLFDCNISVEMVPKVMPSERIDNDRDIEYATSLKISSSDVGTCTGDGTSLSSGCKRKNCTETHGMCSKRKRVDCNDHPSPKAVLQDEKLPAGDREGSSASRGDKIHATSSSLHQANNILKIPDLKMVEWESRRKQRDSQKNLHVLLRPQIAKLCEVLQLKEDVKAMVERFLEYVMNNHLVSTDVDPLPYASSEVHARCLANSKMQNASQAAETSPFNGAIDVSNPDAMVVELSEKMQQRRSSESTSNLSPLNPPHVTAVEHQSNNEGQTADGSSQSPRQPAENHIELSNQDVLLPLDSPIDSVIDGLVLQAKETRAGPVPSVSNGLPLQTSPAGSSRMPMTSFRDPLQIEMERIMKEKQKTTKIYEDSKVQLKLERYKEIEEVVAQIRRKYEVKLKEKEAEFLLQMMELDVCYKKVVLNKTLAEAFRSTSMDNRVSGSAGAKQGGNSSFLHQLFQPSPQQIVQHPSAASGFPSTSLASSMPTVSSAAVNAQTMSPSLQPSTASGIPSTGSASSRQTVSPVVVNAQTMGSPLQVVNPLALFSGVPARPLRISTISSTSGNPQIGTEIRARARAPHLQPFRPPPSISPSSLPLHSGGISIRQAHNNLPVASLSLLRSYYPLAHRQTSTTVQSVRTQYIVSGGLTAPSNPRVNNPSGGANPPGFLLPHSNSRLATRFHPESQMPSNRSTSAQPSRTSTNIVFLSDGN